jgi:hypothetical protein
MFGLESTDERLEVGAEVPALEEKSRPRTPRDQVIESMLRILLR